MNRAEMTKDVNQLLKDAVARFEESDKSYSALYDVVDDALMWDDDILAVIAVFGNTDPVREYAQDLFIEQLMSLVDIKEEDY